MKKKVIAVLLLLVVILKLISALYLPSSGKFTLLKIFPPTQNYWPSTNDRSLYSVLKVYCLLAIRIPASPDLGKAGGKVLAVDIYFDDDDTMLAECRHLTVCQFGLCDIIIDEDRERYFVTLPFLYSYVRSIYDRISV